LPTDGFDEIRNDDSTNVCLDQKGGALGAGHQGPHIYVCSGQADTIAGGIGDKVCLGVDGHCQTGIAVFKPMVSIGNTRGQSVVCRAKDSPLSNCYSSDFCGWILSPTGYMGGQLQEA
jgi:hypothetical protein